jgi:lipid-A-disaccharide synthase
VTSAHRTSSSTDANAGGLEPRTVCFVTVDPSGDAIGAAVAEELRAQAPVRLYGVGGPAMRHAGIELLCDAMEWSALGVVAYLRVYWRARQGNLWIRRRLRELQPDLLVLIDCGAFNVPIARTVKQWYRQKVLYYIPPRCWSRKWKVKGIADVADYVAAPFPWNVHGDDGTGRVRFVGHPAADLLAKLPPRDDVLRNLGLDPDRLTLGVLPGSRKLELRVHLPILFEAVRLLREEFGELQIVLSRAPTVEPGVIEDRLQQAGLGDVRIVEGAGLAFRGADAALVCLGTATLEGCVVGCPMVAFYRGTALQGLEFLLKPPRTRYFAMPSIIADEPVVTELIQNNVTPQRLADEAAVLLRDPGRRAQAAQRLQEVASALGGQGATRRAAGAVRAALDGQWHDLPHALSAGGATPAGKMPAAIQ